MNIEDFRLQIPTSVLRIFSACCWRYFSKPSWIFLSDNPKILKASSPAFLAPDFPMATAATGTPGGIWTVDKRESRPFKAVDSTGTPITGRGVRLETKPDKAAEPPDP